MMIVNLTKDRKPFHVCVKYSEGTYEPCIWSIRKVDNRETDESACKVRLLNIRKNINE